MYNKLQEAEKKAKPDPAKKWAESWQMPAG